MGFNCTLCGFKNVQEFVTAMYKSEKEHLLAFLKYIKAIQLDDELRDKKWTEFARRYNGPAYTKNKYDIKLAAAYKKYSV